MIERLYIKNFAIIKELTLNLSSGLNIFSGETGAGKSIIVESISFLFGARYYGEVESNMQVVSAVLKINKKILPFLEDERVEVKRIYGGDRKSRYYLNSKPVNFSIINEISKNIIDFHAQMENNLITSPITQLEILDKYLNIEKEVENFSKLYRKRKEIEERLNTLLMNDEEKKRLIELYEYQLKEIEQANLKENEDAELEEVINRIKNLSKIKSALNEMISRFEEEGGINDLMTKVLKKAGDLSAMDDKFGVILNEIEKINELNRNFLELIKSYDDEYNITDEKIDEYIKRDELIKSLKKKYSCDLNGLIRKKYELKKAIEEISTSTENINILKKELSDLTREMEIFAEKIDRIRRDGSEDFSKHLEKEIKKLGFEHCLFRISIDKTEEFNERGKNTIEFLFSANPDQLIKPLRYVASGGELSRVMLAIKAISINNDFPKTFIFDEIDSGIGGNTAFFVGQSLKRVSRNNQILSITHMPQIAVFADRHFKIEKRYINKKTEVELMELKTDDMKIDEISRMLGSIYSPDTARKHAKELLKRALEFQK